MLTMKVVKRDKTEVSVRVVLAPNNDKLLGYSSTTRNRIPLIYQYVIRAHIYNG